MIMKVDSAEFLHPRPTAYSRIQLEYAPSADLNTALQDFITPSHRHDRQFGVIALHSEAYANVPLVPGGHPLEHPPEWSTHLLEREIALRAIASHQLRLASFVNVRSLPDERGLAIYLELLPDEHERRHLGQLAVRGRGERPGGYGVVAHIPGGVLSDNYGVAASQLRNLLDVPSVDSEATRITYAPRTSQLWVERAMLRDRMPSSVRR